VKNNRATVGDERTIFGAIRFSKNTLLARQNKKFVIEMKVFFRKENKKK
jgi:hypothetical protein